MSTSPVTLTVLPRLRAAGIKCRIYHSRYVIDSALCGGPTPRVHGPFRVRRKGSSPLFPHLRWAPHGGETTVDLLFPDGTSYSGTAKCSREDRFNRLEGIRIALGRALAARKGHQHVLRVEAGGFSAL